jgi:hypothetical protein
MGGVPPDPARLARPPDPGLGRRVSVEVERTVDAPIERVWALLRDYRVARPRLLTEHLSDYHAIGGFGIFAGFSAACGVPPWEVRFKIGSVGRVRPSGGVEVAREHERRAGARTHTLCAHSTEEDPCFVLR